jgi:hypothetical protein
MREALGMTLTIAAIACPVFWLLGLSFAMTTFAADRAYLSGDGFVAAVVSAGFLVYAWATPKSGVLEVILWLAVLGAAFSTWIFFKDLQLMTNQRSERERQRKKVRARD